MSLNMENINYNDFKDICRTCMIKCNTKFPQNDMILDVFYKLTNIHFETNEELPQQICLNCFEKIKDINSFAFQCKQIHSKLMKCLNHFKDLQTNEELQDVNTQKRRASIKIEENLTNDEHKYEFVNDAELIATNELKIDNTENTNDELNENVILDTSEFCKALNINCDESSIVYIEVINEEESNNSVNLNVLNEDTSINSGDNSQIISSEENKDVLNETQDEQYKCDICNKTFNNLKTFEKHKNVHSSERPFLCEICDKTFARLGLLNRHKRIHSGERPYKCNICSKSFINSYVLKQHMCTHTGVRSYQCDRCSTSFIHLHHLKRHLLIHGSERPYKCDQCPKTFIQLDHLKRHSFTHNGERPYKCKQCTLSFAQSNNLKSHMRIHSGERPYKCKYCTKSFKRSNQLSIHKRTHNGERPHHCKLCFKSFSQSNNLNRHMRTHNAKKPKIDV